MSNFSKAVDLALDKAFNGDEPVTGIRPKEPPAPATLPGRDIRLVLIEEARDERDAAEARMKAAIAELQAARDGYVTAARTLDAAIQDFWGDE